MLALALLGSAAAQGWCTAHAPEHACQFCKTETDCQPKPDGKTWYCQAAKDPNCGDAPKIGFCKKDSPGGWGVQCEPCSSEQDCGHTPDGKVFYCQKFEDPQCGSVECDGGASCVCKHESPKNQCGSCHKEVDCGEDPDGKISYCMNKDAQCGAKTTGFCTHDAPKNHCDGCNSEEDCGHTLDGKIYYCQQAKDAPCGGPHPPPASHGFCAPWAPSRCANCTSDLECGNEKDACWAVKDPQCKPPTIELV